MRMILILIMTISCNVCYAGEKLASFKGEQVKSGQWKVALHYTDRDEERVFSDGQEMMDFLITFFNAKENTVVETVSELKAAVAKKEKEVDELKKKPAEKPIEPEEKK